MEEACGSEKGDARGFCPLRHFGQGRPNGRELSGEPSERSELPLAQCRRKPNTKAIGVANREITQTIIPIRDRNDDRRPDLIRQPPVVVHVWHHHPHVRHGKPLFRIEDAQDRILLLCGRGGERDEHHHTDDGEKNPVSALQPTGLVNPGLAAQRAA